MQMVEPDIFSGIRAPLLVLNLLSIATALAAAMIVADALVAWRDPSRGPWAAEAGRKRHTSSCANHAAERDVR